MKFDFDLEKSIVNKIRHGIDFFEAQSLWGNAVVEVKLTQSIMPRSAVIGVLDEKYWAAIIAYVDGYIRPICVRPALEEEIALYEETPV